jgi:CDGSH-type Zn-finger protein
VSADDEPQRIMVLPDGPYLVYGGVPLRRKRKIVAAENNAALTWQTGDMTLCRCGHSAGKPLCDGTHRKIDFREEERGPATRPAGSTTTETGRTT